MYGQWCCEPFQKLQAPDSPDHCHATTSAHVPPIAAPAPACSSKPCWVKKTPRWYATWSSRASSRIGLPEPRAAVRSFMNCARCAASSEHDCEPPGGVGGTVGLGPVVGGVLGSTLTGALQGV